MAAEGAKFFIKKTALFSLFPSVEMIFSGANHQHIVFLKDAGVADPNGLLILLEYD